MANRHKSFKRGGKAYTCSAGGNSDVLSEAKKRASGGEVKVTGKAAGGRLDRKSGGGVGKSPFSSAGGGSADKSPFFK